MPKLTTVYAEDGPAYVDLDKLVCISAPMKKKGHDQARVLVLEGGFRLYVLDSKQNFDALRELLPTNVTVEAQRAPAKAPKDAPSKPTRKPRLVRRKPEPAVLTSSWEAAEPEAK